MLLGVGCSLLLVGGVVFISLWSGSGNRGATPGSGPNAGLPGDGASAPPVDVASVGRTGRAFNEILEKDTARVKQHVAWREMNPLPKGQYEAIEPRAWLYLKDGKTLEVQAATGRIRFTPDSKQKRPESGRFEGGVWIRMYAPGVLPPGAVKEAVTGATATAPPSPPSSPSPPDSKGAGASVTDAVPMLVGYAASLNFDTLTNEYSTSDRVMVSTDEIESEFDGLRVVYNEVQARPDLVEAANGFVRITKKAKTPEKSETKATDAKPSDAKSAPVSPATPDVPANPGTTPAGAAPASAPKIQHYRTDFSDAVELAGRGQAVTADKLMLWVRLVDGKAPETDDRATAPAPSEASETKQNPSTPADPAATDKSPASPTGTPAPSGTPAATPPSANETTPTKPTGPTILDRLASLRAMPAVAPKPLAPVRDDDAMLTWRGAVSLFALDEPPAELSKDDATARFVSESERPVTLRDTRRPDAPFATCGTLEYGATSKDAVLTSPASRGVVMIDPKNRRRGAVDHFAINLKTGIAQARGAGVLTAIKSDDAKDATADAGATDAAKLDALITRLATTTDDDRVIMWSEQADFVFQLEGGAKGTSDSGIKSIRETMFTGAVTARDGRSLVSGDFLKASFAPGKKSDTVFTRVEVEGNAHGEANDPKKPLETKRLDADRFDIAFTPDAEGKESDPSVLTATGNVRGFQIDTKEVTDKSGAKHTEERTTTLTTSLLEAELETTKDAKGRKRTDVRTARTKNGMEFKRSDGLAASATDMHAEMATKIIDFAGPEVVLSRGASSVRGTDMRLNGIDNALDVRSAGSLAHSETGGTTKVGTVSLSWNSLLKYNDSTGEGECIGAAKMVQEQDRLHRATINAERMAMRMETAAERKQRETAEGKAPSGELSAERLLRAEAHGTGDTPDTRAKIESREYIDDATAANGRSLQRLTYLEARTVIADEEHGVFDVPTSGRALILDHRVATDETPAPAANTPAAAPSVIPTSNPRGTTLLGWGGTLKFTRAAGLIEMQNATELTHKPLDAAQQPLKIVADRMEGHLRPKPPKSTSEGTSGAAPVIPSTGLAGIEQDQLVKAVALGNVVVTTLSEDMRLSAARVEYDADTRVLTATAGSEPGESVEYIDTKRGTPVVGKKLIVRIKDDGKHELQIVEPMPMTVPIPK